MRLPPARRRRRPGGGPLTQAQAARLHACVAVLEGRARVVAVVAPADPATAVLTGALAPGVELVTVAPAGGASAGEGADGPVDVLYVGGHHDYAPALADLERWGARVVPGGTLLVRGAFSSLPVTAALLRAAGAGPRWRYAGREGALAEYTRADLSRGERVVDALAQLAQAPFLALENSARSRR